MKVQALLVCLTAISGCSFSASAQPQTSSKAFDYFETAATLIVDEDKIGTVLTTEAREELVEKNREALVMVRRGLAYDYHRPPDLYQGDMFAFLEEISMLHKKWRRLSRLLAADGDANAAREDWNAASNAYIDAIKLGNEVIRDGPMLDLIVGIAIQAIGLRPLEKSIASLDETTARRAARRLESIFLSRPSFKSTLQADLRFGESEFLRAMDGTADEKYRDEAVKKFRNLGLNAIEETTQPYVAYSQIRLLNSILYPEDEPEPMNDDEDEEGEDFTLLGVEDPAEAAQMYFKFSYSALPSYRFMDEVSRTRIQMLMSALALRAYQAEHGKYPASLEELVPTYLEKVLMDPFGWDAPLCYKIEEEKYRLYSIGPDGRDGGGQPIENLEQTGRLRHSVLYTGANAQGDIVFGVNN